MKSKEKEGAPFLSNSIKPIEFFSCRTVTKRKISIGVHVITCFIFNRFNADSFLPNYTVNLAETIVIAG